MADTSWRPVVPRPRAGHRAVPVQARRLNAGRSWRVGLPGHRRTAGGVGVARWTAVSARLARGGAAEEAAEFALSWRSRAVGAACDLCTQPCRPVAGALVTSVCAPPLLRAVLWSPKPVLAASLRRAGLPHAAAAGESSFRHAGWPRQEPSVHRQPTCRSSFSVKVACPPAPRLPLERPRRPQPPTKGLTGGLNRQPDG